jgi:hypothetical protein
MSPDGAPLDEREAAEVRRRLTRRVSEEGRAPDTASTRSWAVRRLVGAYQQAGVRPQLPEPD